MGRYPQWTETLIKILLFAVSTCALAQESTSDVCLAEDNHACTSLNAEDPAATNSSFIPGTHAGNPISLTTGNKYQRETDYQSEDSHLQFVRHYNSLSADKNQGLGHGWSHTFDTRLVRIEQNDLLVGFDITQSTGKRIRFRTKDNSADENGLYRAQYSSDGYLIVGNKDQNGQIQWKTPDGRTLRFRGSFLVRIDYPGHQFLSLYYQQLRLSEISDQTGRTIKLVYEPGP